MSNALVIQMPCLQSFHQKPNSFKQTIYRYYVVALLVIVSGCAAEVDDPLAQVDSEQVANAYELEMQIGTQKLTFPLSASFIEEWKGQIARLDGDPQRLSQWLKDSGSLPELQAALANNPDATLKLSSKTTSPAASPPAGPETPFPQPNVKVENPGQMQSCSAAVHLSPTYAIGFFGYYEIQGIGKFVDSLYRVAPDEALAGIWIEKRLWDPKQRSGMNWVCLGFFPYEGLNPGLEDILPMLQDDIIFEPDSVAKLQTALSSIPQDPSYPDDLTLEQMEWVREDFASFFPEKTNGGSWSWNGLPQLDLPNLNPVVAFGITVVFWLLVFALAL
ncbi:MAG: hypothetical protein IPJ88_10620 [Myxococcales bacterium]|nr:MAG: hypothetical protein IPJ88_10620 [Myxococcales bacterium]